MSTGGLIFAVAGAMAAGASAQESRKPNIVVIVADDMGYADCGFQGCKDIPTPSIDSLAAHGVRLTRGYVSGPYCSPTRAGLMTGRYQQRFGHEFNPTGGNKLDSDVGLPLTETTIADRLKGAGYATGLVGKWHLGHSPKFHPIKRGFQEFYGFLDGAHSYVPDDGPPILRGETPVAKPPYLTDAFGEEAAAFIERHKREPFFLYLAFNAVHTPMQAPQSRLDRFSQITDPRRRTYAGMLTSMDDAVGKVLAKLRGEGLEENSLIFFFSDNGGPTMRGTTINGSSNAPLRGSKRTTLEGGIRVPFVVQWKTKLPEGKVFEQQAIQLDVLPTALAAAGVEVKSEWELDGVNLLPYLSGAEQGAPHETLFWRLGTQRAITQSKWKLVEYDPVADGLSAKDPLPKRLYDLLADPGEEHDVSSKHPGVARELNSQWQAWAKTLAEPLWGASIKRRAAN
jgi:arylsulfatase A-like enzyme